MKEILEIISVWGDQIYNSVYSTLYYLREEYFAWIYKSWLFKLIWYSLLAYDGISHIPQIRKNLRADPYALYEAVALSPILFNAGLGLGILIVSPYYLDPILLINGLVLMLVFSISASILLVRRKKPE